MVPVLLLAALLPVLAAPAEAQTGTARNVSDADLQELSRLSCVGSYDLTPNRLAEERAKAGQGAIRLTFALAQGSLTVKIERQPGIAAWREPATVREYPPAVMGRTFYVVKDRMWFSGPAGDHYALRLGFPRLFGTLDPQDQPQFRHQGLGRLELACRQRLL